MDLKPSNVLMTPDGRPMLLDFNLAFDRQVNDTRLGGTLPYMSPEQLEAIGSGKRDASSSVRASSDLFSLGIILYELLTGKHPFGPVPLKLSPKEIREHLVERQRHGVRPIRELNPGVDTSLARIIERCLAADPKSRPESAVVLAADLRRSLSVSRRLRRWTVNHPVLALILLVASLSAGSVAAYWLATREPYAVRHFHAGVRAYGGQDYNQGIAELDLTIDADKNNREAWFTRGKAYQALGKFEAALGDYGRANELSPDGRTYACIGYCQNKGKQPMPDKAMGSYLAAIRLGFDNAAVHNNYGYSCLELGNTDANLKNANDQFAIALSMDPNLQAAYYNRALGDFHVTNRKLRYVPLPAVADIEQAIRVEPPAGDLFLLATVIYAYAAERDGAHRSRWTQRAPPRCWGAPSWL